MTAPDGVCSSFSQHEEGCVVVQLSGASYRQSTEGRGASKSKLSALSYSIKLDIEYMIVSTNPPGV